jgi:hypothetical protein
MTAIHLFYLSIITLFALSGYLATARIPGERRR